MKHWIAPAVLLALTACATPVQQAAAPAQAPVFDPVGVYDFSTNVQGDQIAGVLTLRRAGNELTGTVSTGMTGEIMLQRVMLDGRRAVLRAPTQQGDMVMTVDFADDNRITGGWQLATGLSGTLTGQRRQP